MRPLGFVITEDFFKDLQEEFKNWEANAASQGKPKSLWEELAVRLPAYILICLFLNYDVVFRSNRLLLKSS